MAALLIEMSINCDGDRTTEENLLSLGESLLSALRQLRE